MRNWGYRSEYIRPQKHEKGREKGTMNTINNNSSIHHIPMSVCPRTRVYERGGAKLRFCGISKPAPQSNSFDSPNNFCPVNGSHANEATQSPILASVARGCVTSPPRPISNNDATRGHCGAHVRDSRISSKSRHEYDPAAVRFCGIADRRVIGTSGPKSTEDARGNSRNKGQSLFLVRLLKNG
jgi:hypothetical protein